MSTAANVATQADALHITDEGTFEDLFGRAANSGGARQILRRNAANNGWEFVDHLPADVIRDADFALNGKQSSLLVLTSVELLEVLQAGSGGVNVQNDGGTATAATTLNFTGDGVTTAGTGNTQTITINAGSGGGGAAAEIMYSNLPLNEDPGNPTDNPENWQDLATFTTTQKFLIPAPNSINNLDYRTGVSSRSGAIDFPTS